MLPQKTAPIRSRKSCLRKCENELVNGTEKGGPKDESAKREAGKRDESRDEEAAGATSATLDKVRNRCFELSVR